MIKVDECEPIGELEAKFPYRDVQIKRGVDVKGFYDLEAEIGRGKFGTVYLCREKATNLSLAAKFVGIQRRQDRKNVEREVEIMRTLQHPRLIQLYDAFETDNTMVVVLELIEGGELFERVIGDDFILTEKACTIFMRQICEGVAFIHKNNIIHLDLKPENILCLTKTGNRIKIIDFGLARHYEPGSKLQVLFGTPEFVAPEVVNFDQISPATDMWSVGVICYVLLSGLSPFMGDTDVETMTNVTLSRYDFDDDSFDNISENAKDFITNLLLKKKEARLTADQCLDHPWLRRKIPPPPPELITTKENLKSFVDNYHNINVIAENNGDAVINRKPSALSAVELIAASDKEFLNRDDVKSFSNIRNENIVPPVRFPVVVTNKNVVPVTNDNNLSVNNVSNTNDDVLNMVNANISSMPPLPVLDNASAIPNIPLVPQNVANINQIVQLDERESENNNVFVADTTEAEVIHQAEKLSSSVPLADLPPRVIAAPDVPVAHLPFISKSLPAAAAMLDESMVDQLKPLHIPLIPSLSIPEDVDEPIIVHPPVIGTTLPPKRGSTDVDSMIPKRDTEDLERFNTRHGSIDVISLIQKRGSIDMDNVFTKRGSIGMLPGLPEGFPKGSERRGSFKPEEVVVPPNESDVGPIRPVIPQPTTFQPSTPFFRIPQNIVQTDFPTVEPPSAVMLPPPSMESPNQTEIVAEVLSTTPVSPPAPLLQPLVQNIGILAEIITREVPHVSPIAATAPQEFFKVVSSPPLQPEPLTPVHHDLTPQPSEDIFVPQPPPVVKVLSTSPVSPPNLPHTPPMTEVKFSSPVSPPNIPPTPQIDEVLPTTSVSPPAVPPISSMDEVKYGSPVTLPTVPTIPSHEIITHIHPLEPQPSTSFQVNKFEPTELTRKPIPYSPSPPPKAPTSMVSTNTINPPRRESPLQKTLDEIPKLSSEILSSISNIPSLSKTTNYDTSTSRTSLGTTRRSTTESSSYSTYDKVSSGPRLVSFTEHKTSSYTTSAPQKSFPKIQGVSLGRSQSEDKSAFANVSSRGYSSSVRRSEAKEIETSRQSKTETLTRTEVRNKGEEAEAPGFKTRLRSTAPWFSERKAESEKNIEKKSTDMSSLLKEALGPLEMRSPWAREIRQISAKLVELSKDASTRKQQEEEHVMEMNKQQSARRQKFKVSVLNRDVVFGAAREFYLGGEVPVGSSPLKDQQQGKYTASQTQQSKSSTVTRTRSSPDDRKPKPSFRTAAK
ncbi:hypothetical protein GE061_001196 [Apolygus lucorum]|uniref:Uncharacterized protein n=1 Tax=Apolygus lucorum TaxID=248454 RepID=A0A6A4K0T9_APOLU|nr:hypothetical protein GE061_001196 [Apolygus lucorum]